MKTLPLPLLALLVMLTACVKLDPNGPYQSDRVLYDADTAIVLADSVFVGFMKWEKDHRAELAKYPDVKKTADLIRLHNREWLGTAIAARDAYELLRSTQTETALQDALTVLRSALADAQKYMKP